MDLNYRIKMIDKNDKSEKTVMTGLTLSDMKKQFGILVTCQDPSEPIMYAVEPYVPVGTVCFKGVKDAN